MKPKTKKSNPLSFLTGLILLAHFMVLAAFVFSLLAGIIPTDKLWIFSFFGLIYLPLYVANVGFTAFWAVIGRKFWMLSILPLILGFMIFRGHFNVRFTGSHAKTKDEIKVMTFNVHEFSPIHGTTHDDFMHEAFATIEKEHPDIACFQDYAIDIKGKYGIEGLQKQLGLPYSANSNYLVYSDQNYVSGVGILSRYPIIASKPLTIDSGYTCLSADIQYKHQKIRVICIHLQSYTLYADEKVILSAPRSFSNFDEKRIKKDSRKIAGKLRWAFRRRAPEARWVAEYIKESPYPVILCGDFNDTPASYVYRTISKSLQDPFLIQGSGIARTYNQSKYPFRIDYILHSDQFKSLDYKIIPTNLSDHNPVTTVLKME